MKNLIATICLTIALCTGALATQNHTCQGGHNCNGTGGGANGPSNVNNGGDGGSGGIGYGGAGGDSNAIAGASATSTSTSGASSNQSQKQGQGQTQGQGQSQTADNNGNAQSTSTTFNQNQVRQAPTAYAPDAFPSAPCRVSGSAGVSAPIGGVSLGGSKLDKDCSRRETARSFMSLGLTEAACKILLSTKDAKEAGLTQADCVVPVQAQTVVTPEVKISLDPTSGSR